jgi:hypothetical protein
MITVMIMICYPGPGLVEHGPVTGPRRGGKQHELSLPDSDSASLGPSRRDRVEPRRDSVRVLVLRHEEEESLGCERGAESAAESLARGAVSATPDAAETDQPGQTLIPRRDSDLTLARPS